MISNFKKLLYPFILVSLIAAPVTYADNHIKSDKVTVRADTASPDNTIEIKLRTIYNLNPVLNKYNFKIESKNGIVNIQGAVANASEKDLAIDIAKVVEGVKEIKENIAIDKNVKTGEAYSSWAQKITDATITSLVKSKLLLDPRTTGTQIHVTTVNNTVNLTGKVKSDIEKQAAEDISINTSGVTAVKNSLEVSANIED